MSELTRICWSGLTGRTGREAISQLKKVDNVEIVSGISRFDHGSMGGLQKIEDVESCADGLYVTGSVDFSGIERWYCYDGIANPLKELSQNFNILVDFSSADVFDRVLDLAVRTHVPLISGTSRLSNRQMARLYDATNSIPIFRGGNFRFKVKKFIDEVVELAMEGGDFVLNEKFYAGKSLPSETSRVIQRRIMEATGKHLDVFSNTPYAQDSLICEWIFTTENGELSCKTEGFDELAHDVLEIAKVMIRKPVRPGKFYDLDEIWDELPH